MSYFQLAENQRYQIDVLLQTGKSQRAIARTLGVRSSTISREVRRNSRADGYCAWHAQRTSDQRRSSAPKAHKITPNTIKRIEALVRQDWPPEIVAGYLRWIVGISVSHEWIYQHIWRDRAEGGDLFWYLPRRGKRYRRSRAGRSLIPNRIGIEQRPEIVDDRSRLGDWEVDTVLGSRRGAALVTIVERKSRFMLIGKVERKYADLTRQTIIRLLGRHRGKLHTLTADNGGEFVEHERVSKALGLDFYFAHPYSAWERGTNEQSNGLIRRYLPKGMSFNHVTEKDLEWIVDRLNNRPRKCLRYRTPHEVFYEKTAENSGNNPVMHL